MARCLLCFGTGNVVPAPDALAYAVCPDCHGTGDDSRVIEGTEAPAYEQPAGWWPAESTPDPRDAVPAPGWAVALGIALPAAIGLLAGLLLGRLL